MEARLLKALILSLTCILLFQYATAQVCDAQGSCYYASTSGSGTACSFANPCKISAALPMLGAGDHLYLRGGTYTEFMGTGQYRVKAIISIDKYFDFASSPTTDRPIVISSYPGESVTIRGDYSARCIFIDGESNIVIQGLTVEQCWEAGIYIGYDAAADNIKVQDSTFREIVCTDNMGGVFINNAKKIVVNHNIFRDSYYQGMKSSLDSPDCKGLGLIVFRATDLTISNNDFANTCSGMYYKHGEPTLGSGGYTYIINNTWHDLASGSGIAVNQNRAYIADNLLIGAGIRTHNEDGTVAPFTYNVTIANNTIIDGYIDFEGGSEYPGTIEAKVLNNIIYSSSYDIWPYGSDAEFNKGIGLISESNCYYVPGSKQKFDFFGSDNPAFGGENTGGTYSLAEWKAKGYDVLSVEANPQFMDMAGGDFCLQPGSPCESKGVCRLIDSPTCHENWVCGTWSACTTGMQTRTCTDANACGSTSGKPAESQSCTIQCIHDADIPPCDGCVMQDEMMQYVQKWKAGQVTLSSLMEAIRLWKQGC